MHKDSYHIERKLNVDCELITLIKRKMDVSDEICILKEELGISISVIFPL